MKARKVENPPLKTAGPIATNTARDLSSPVLPGIIKAGRLLKETVHEKMKISQYGITQPVKYGRVVLVPCRK